MAADLLSVTKDFISRVSYEWRIKHYVFFVSSIFLLNIKFLKLINLAVLLLHTIIINPLLAINFSFSLHCSTESCILMDVWIASVSFFFSDTVILCSLFLFLIRLAWYLFSLIDFFQRTSFLFSLIFLSNIFYFLSSTYICTSFSCLR